MLGFSNIISTKESKWYLDWGFWLLLIMINMSGNLGFGILFNDKILVISLFLISTFIAIDKKRYTAPFLIFAYLFFIISFLPGIYASDTFSYSSTYHILMKMLIGINLVVILQERFIDYYIRIILTFAVISLVCFGLNYIGIIIPYIKVESTSLDGGNIFRVSSLIYTQLYNMAANGITLRNCGPFWEPGAYQGFLNLCFLMLNFSSIKRDIFYYFLLLILSITIITTFSTGGYIVLFINLLIALFKESRITFNTKLLLSLGGLLVGLLYFFNTDFLYNKISNDEGRLGVSLDDLGDGFYALFGYGYSGDSIQNSAIKTASGLLGLIKYSGIVGFILYLGKLFGTTFTSDRFIWGFSICLILMNEPFLTAGPFWWGVPFLWPYVINFDNILE